MTEPTPTQPRNVLDLTRKIDDWSQWHDAYDDPDSELALRKRGVQQRVAEVVDACVPGPVQVVSICAGQGRELIEPLARHPRRADVRGRLIELDAHNAAVAEESIRAAKLDGLEVCNTDASVSDAYEGLPPVDLVVISGLFGHIDDDDQVRLLRFLGQILRPDGAVVWTFFARAKRRTERLRRYFVEQSLEEVEFDVLPGEEYRFTVALSRFRGVPLPFEPGVSLFTFGSSRANRSDDFDQEA